MLFSYNWLKDYLKGSLPKPEKLAEILTMRSFEVESVEKKKGDYILDIDILPNRSHDCLSHWGLAREISAITGGRLNPLKSKKLKIKKGKLKPIDLKIKCSKLVPRYSAIVIEDVKIKKSPKWLKDRVESIGARSINNIVDLTNYLMLETGQPFHAFDYDKINGAEMILRESKKGEKITTLDGKSHVLDQGTMIIGNKGNLIDLVGVMGGKISEVDSNTKNIVLQAGNFNSQAIYRTVKDLNHKTEASDIYSQGIDPNLTIPALERAYFLLDKLGAGNIVQIIDIYPKKTLPKKIKLNLDYAERLLGIKISDKQVRGILQSLGLKIENCKLKILNVVVPTFRLDINIKEDLIEEIGRIYGYDKIKSDFPVASLIPPKRNASIFWEDFAKNILKEAGFAEVYNYSFIGEKEADFFGLRLGSLRELENPVSSDYRYLRPSLIINLLKNVEFNLKYFDKIKIFELGKIFQKFKLQNSNLKITAQNLKLREKRMLSGLIVSKKRADDLFYQLKGTIDSLLNKLGISDICYDDYQTTPEDSDIKIWQKGKTAEIKINSKEIGFLGEISEEILNKLKIKEKVFLFDIDFEKLQKFCREEHEYFPVSQYPASVRDIAVLVPFDVKVVDVLNKINLAGGKLVRDVDLFDIYEGEELPEGKKNFAFHIIYQAEDRTLTSSEIDVVQKKIIKGLEEDPEWEVRK